MNASVLTMQLKSSLRQRISFEHSVQSARHARLAQVTIVKEAPAYRTTEVDEHELDGAYPSDLARGESPKLIGFVVRLEDGPVYENEREVLKDL